MNDVAENRGYRLVSSDTGKFTVVRVSDGQVESAMPGDMPTDGGKWVAPDTDKGVRYVSSWYSENYARRVFRSLVREAEDADPNFERPAADGPKRGFKARPELRRTHRIVLTLHDQERAQLEGWSQASGVPMARILRERAGFDPIKP